MSSKGINGIGNMISHSFESSYYFIEQHLKEHKNGNNNFHTLPFTKYKMYGTSEPRIKSYGWEECPVRLFNINKYKIELLKKIGAPKSKIIWGEKVSNLIGSTVTSNNFFV
jgi:hypothetical protein